MWQGPVDVNVGWYRGYLDEGAFVDSTPPGTSSLKLFSVFARAPAPGGYRNFLFFALQISSCTGFLTLNHALEWQGRLWWSI
ncbi:hypothetical protein I7I50_03026 [Histoplasma capsulatum G186AR]|uniref:Uncharacterized protein n=1 Tax=Ajellomyces capsulatus TaxID=5037 RepID=A0A8H7Z4G5_AJECA|nr:hypothetical protein I7I52_00308 [Histoplasma capsulatum]QSS71984.1 hypothetical protein I7I50_03026 [Histoplasma capsulatum G186AR]